MYSFEIRTHEGFTWKVLAELLASNIKECCLQCNQTGIYIKAIDEKCTLGSKFICTSLYKENFKKFHCPTETLIGLNLINFFKVLKSIKRKDGISMYIEDCDPQKLYIEIEPQGDNKPVKKWLNIINVSPSNMDFTDDEYYSHSILSTSKEFQKLKTLQKTSKDITVTLVDGCIKFFVDKPELYGGEVIFGEKTEKDDDQVEVYTQTFITEDIMQLLKVAGLSPVVHIYYVQGMPLKINLNVGTLGELSICIKSKEMVAEEKAKDE